MKYLSHIIRLSTSGLLLGWIATVSPVPVTLALLLLFVRAELEAMLWSQLRHDVEQFQLSVLRCIKYSTDICQTVSQLMAAVMTQSDEPETTAQTDNTTWFIDPNQEQKRRH